MTTPARYRAQPDLGLDACDPSGKGTGGAAKVVALDEMEKLGTRLADLQERLYAENARLVLVVLQGMDTSGKGGVGKSVVGLMHPVGVHITSFKAPTAQERAHHFLWRIQRCLPNAGHVGVFDRSHYEDVGIVVVHHLIDQRAALRRYDEINRFEEELRAAGTTVVKCFLHISYAEQAKRLLARLVDPEKRWKFNPSDLDEREQWPDYMTAYSRAITHTNPDTAPWFVIPANHKWLRDWAITRILVEVLEEMDPKFPQPDLDIEGLEARLAAQVLPG